MEYLTDKCIHVCGINRSGQHAISSWLLGTIEHALYKNNISFALSKGAKQDPIFRLGYQKSQKWKYQYKENGIKKNSGVKFLDYNYRNYRDAIMYGSEMSSPEDFIRGYDGFFPAHEKELIEQLQKMNKEYTNLKGISPETYFIFVLRSPWNHISSSWFWRGPRHRVNQSKLFSSLWIAYAEEFLGITNYIPDNFVPVLYDKWFVDQEYRKGICDKIGVEFTDNQLNTVSHFGGGSTFQGKGDGQSLGVLSRWERCFEKEKATEHLVKTLTTNKKMLEYSNSLFGPTPDRIIEEIEKG